MRSLLVRATNRQATYPRGMNRLSPRAVILASTVAGSALFIAGAVAVGAEWLPFAPETDTTCADGSAVSFLERPAARDKVVLFFEGGGACFSAETCAFGGDEQSYISESPPATDFLAERGGIFDFDDSENPLSDHTFVYVPYCTGDAHLGTTTRRYSADLTVEHKGFINGSAALDHLVAAYPGTTELVVAGVSAGSIPTPLFAALAADRLPDARVVTLGDSSGAYPDVPALNGFVGNLWGADGAIPDWPVTTGTSLEDWGVPGLYVFAGQHAPGIVFAKFDYADDEAQGFYTGLVGLETGDLGNLIGSIEADIESAGVPVASYVAPGDAHTILGSDDFYALEVDGVRFVDWFAALIAGESPPDVACSECG
jgi:hypothetical protein